MKFNKICMCLRPFLNGLSFLLGILFLGLMSCSSASTAPSAIDNSKPLYFGLAGCTVNDPLIYQEIPHDPTKDKTPPTVTASSNKSLEIDKTSTVTLTFSEKVKCFTKNDVKFFSTGFSLNDVVISNFITNSPKEYSFDVTPKAYGTLTIRVPANSLYDLSGNKNANRFSTSLSVVDKTPPTVNIYSETLIEGQSSFLSFIFSENVTNFTIDDIQLLLNRANIEKGDFVSNSLKDYSLEIAPTAIGTLQVSIPANSFYDLSGNKNDKPYSDSFTVLDSSTVTYTISFKLNGGSFISSQITNLKVVDNTPIEQTKLEEILSYPPTGPKPSIQVVTRDIFEWRNNDTKYELSTPVTSDLTLEAVWSNSCGQVETIHPANRTQLVDYLNLFIPRYINGYPPPYATNLNHVDVSAIADMGWVFLNKRSFNGNMYCWNTANVKNMNGMFYTTYAFNQDISSWNVANVKNMADMFFQNFSFNQNIDSWDVGNVTDMKKMFWNAKKFNQPIGSWDVGNVKNMYRMFYFANAFNQDITRWDIANVTSMRQMLYYASSFNKDLSSWIVSKETDISDIFHHQISHKRPTKQP